MSCLATCQAFPKHKPQPVKPDFPLEAIVRGSDNKDTPANGIVIGPKTFITARHLNTRPGIKVYITLKTGTKFETIVRSVALPNVQILKGVSVSHDTASKDRYWNGDLAICETDDAFPITPPVIAKFNTGFVTCFHREGTVTTHYVGDLQQWGVMKDSANWLRAQWGKNAFKPGDSGFPWLAYNKARNRWETIGLTSRVAVDPKTLWAAESPKLGGKAFAAKFEEYNQQHQN